MTMQQTGKPYTDLLWILKCIVRTFKFIKEFAFYIFLRTHPVYFLTQYGCRSTKIVLVWHNSTVYAIGYYRRGANVELIVEMELAMSFLTSPLFTIPSCNRRLNISQTQDKIFSLSYSEAYQRVVSCTQARHKKQIAVPWSRNKAYTCMKFLFSLFFLWRGRDGNFVVEGWRRPICYQFVGVNRFLL